MILKLAIKVIPVMALLLIFTAGCSMLPTGDSPCTIDTSGQKYECWGGLSLKGERCLLSWREKGSSKEWVTKERNYRYKRKVRDANLEYACFKLFPKDIREEAPVTKP